MNILVLEGDNKIDSSMKRSLRNIITENDNVSYLFNVYYAKQDEIVKNFMNCDRIAFQSTFIYEDTISQIIDVLLKLERKVDVCILNEDAQEKMANLLDTKQYRKILELGIQFYKMTWGEVDENEEALQLLQFPDLIKQIAEEDEIQRKRLEKIAIDLAYAQSAKNRPTGRKIRVLDVQAFGKEWSELVSGLIVDELDMSETDPSPNRGVWVWGVTEAVKLINDGRYNEYSIETTLDKNAIVKEVVSILGISNISDQNLFTVNGILFIEDETYNLQERVHDILDLFEIERRGNRVKLMNLLSKQPILVN